MGGKGWELASADTMQAHRTSFSSGAAAAYGCYRGYADQMSVLTAATQCEKASQNGRMWKRIEKVAESAGTNVRSTPVRS